MNQAAWIWRRLRLWQYARRPLQPAEVLAYLQAQQQLRPSLPIHHVRFVVFDTETTGLDIRTDQVLSAAGVAVSAGSIHPADSWEATVRRTHTGRAEAVEIHHLLPADLAEGADEQAMAVAFLAFTANAVLVAHHVAFDQAMMERMTKSYIGLPLFHPVLDTALLAQRLEGPAMGPAHLPNASLSLDATCERYGIPPENRHSAAGDAMATACLFAALLRKADRRGIRTLGQLLA